MQKVKRSKAVDAMPELKMLPIFYLFPQELLDASPFSNFPRNPYTVLASEKWMAVYKSDKFLEIVIDGTANMVWKHFGIKASMESFSGYHPFWMIARMGEWMQTTERFGINTYSMTSETFEYPVLSWDVAENIFRAFVEDVRRRLSLDAWRDAVKQYPCHEDYEPSRWSKGRIDFYRKWYQSRDKTQTSFVGSRDDWNALAESASDPWGKVNFWLDFGDFKNTLSAGAARFWICLLLLRHKPAGKPLLARRCGTRWITGPISNGTCSTAGWKFPTTALKTASGPSWLAAKTGFLLTRHAAPRPALSFTASLRPLKKTAWTHTTI